MSINKNNIEEWHERFLLGLLDEQELKQYEHYLAGNPGAREAQHELAQIIRGVEEAARAEMKAEIRQQITQGKYHDSPYILWYRVAAMLFFIVLLPAVIYFNYPGAAPPLALKQSSPTVEKTQTEALSGKEEAAGQATFAEEPPAENIPTLSPPPAQAENAGYGTAGSAPGPNQKNSTSGLNRKRRVEKNMQRAKISKPKPAQLPSSLADIRELPQKQERVSPPDRPLSPLRIQSLQESVPQPGKEDIHPPALPVEKPSPPILIQGKSGRGYRVSSLIVKTGKSRADSIGFMLWEDSGHIRLILSALPEKRVRELPQLEIDDRNEKYLLLMFPDSTRYRLPLGQKTGQAVRLP